MDLQRCKTLSAAGFPVALAPEQMAALIEEVEQLREKVKKQEAALAALCIIDEAKALHLKNKQLQAQIEDLQVIPPVPESNPQLIDLTQPDAVPCHKWRNGFCAQTQGLSPNAVNGVCVDHLACSAKIRY